MNGLQSELLAGPRAENGFSSATAPRKRILFVDDEPSLLQFYRVIFERQGAGWEMDFADNGHTALSMVAGSSYDAVVSDMRMPQLNGAELLREVSRIQPRTARFIISGFSDRELVMKCLPGTHQFMAKPFDIRDLQNKVVRSMEANDWLESSAVRSMIGQLFALPSLPSSYFQILREINSPYAQAENVGAIIARDPSMTAKLLQLVNSAFFGLPRTISNPSEAVMHLGMETVRSLALGIQIFAQFEHLRGIQYPLALHLKHCLRAAHTARAIAQRERLDASLADDAFTAALLMDVGTLVMVQNLTAQFEEAREISRSQMKPLWVAEREVFGTTHAEIGAYLLALWGLPMPIVEAVLHHHQPDRCRNESFSPLTCVHAANALESEHRIDEPPFNIPGVDVSYLKWLRIEDRLPEWRKMVTETRIKTRTN
jgi:HD-like signal output (HDOD) protein/ActR/RegA family two-component response regulator